MAHARRAATTATLAVCTAILLTACGGGGGGGDSRASDGKPADRQETATASSTQRASQAAPSATPTQILAQIKGEQDVEVTIDSAVRDSGGFVTVQGEITNNGTSVFDATKWVGTETAVLSSGASVAGAVLVDEAGKKRYYVLRDTEGKCLCTMDLVDIEPKETRPFFAQFPSPPASTTSVDFELPTMPPAKIPLSEG
jgi:hypothetical protein